jgi:hypothetical protein
MGRRCSCSSNSCVRSPTVREGHTRNHSRFHSLIESLRPLRALGVFAVNSGGRKLTAESQRTQRLRREKLKSGHSMDSRAQVAGCGVEIDRDCDDCCPPLRSGF